MKKTFYFTFLGVLLFFLLSQAGSAQTVSIPGQIPELEEQISVLVDPELPGPNEIIKIKVEAYGTDLTRALITWKINGVVKKTGRGEQSFELNSGKTGTSQIVSITIEPINGPSIEKRLVFKPQEVDILWEARSYTPPFYKGKALQGFMGNVVLVAMPNFLSSGQYLTPRNVTYKWSRNGEIMNNDSGFMKNSILFRGGILLRPEEIKVEAIDDSQNRAVQFATIEPLQPFVAFYENHPLYGILFNKKASFMELKNKEVSLTAVPYFFETTSKKSGDLQYVWSINGQESFIFQNSTATFRYTEGEEGTSIVDLLVKNNRNFLQEASARASIKLQKTDEIQL